jgi:hypothetical protein
MNSKQATKYTEESKLLNGNSSIYKPKIKKKICIYMQDKRIESTLIPSTLKKFSGDRPDSMASVYVNLTDILASSGIKRKRARNFRKSQTKN